MDHIVSYGFIYLQYIVSITKHSELYRTSDSVVSSKRALARPTSSTLQRSGSSNIGNDGVGKCSPTQCFRYLRISVSLHIS